MTKQRCRDLLSEALQYIESLLDNPPITERGMPAYQPDVEVFCGTLMASIEELDKELNEEGEDSDPQR